MFHLERRNWNTVAVFLICNYIWVPVRMHKIHHLSVLSALITPDNTPRLHSVSHNNWTLAVLSDNTEQYSKLFSSPLKAAIGCCRCVSLPFSPWALRSPGVGSEQLVWQQSDILMRWQSARFAILLCGTALWPGAPVGQADPWVYTAGISSCQLRQLPITDVHAATTLAVSSPLCWPYSGAQLATDEMWNVAAIGEPVKGIYWLYGKLACRGK